MLTNILNTSVPRICESEIDLQICSQTNVHTGCHMCRVFVIVGYYIVEKGPTVDLT